MKMRKSVQIQVFLAATVLASLAKGRVGTAEAGTGRGDGTGWVA
jgi:hypothetical protein